MKPVAISKRQTYAPYSIRLSHDERLLLKRAAGKRPLAVYMREKLLGDAAAPRKVMRAECYDDALLGQVLGALGRSRLSANMNQIAHAVNRGALPVDDSLARDLNEACVTLSWMRCTLITALGLHMDGGP